jgi:hypothetical protein
MRKNSGFVVNLSARKEGIIPCGKIVDLWSFFPLGIIPYCVRKNCGFVDNLSARNNSVYYKKSTGSTLHFLRIYICTQIRKWT